MSPTALRPPRHDGYRYTLGGGVVRRPLERLARLCHHHPALPAFDPDEDFMYIGRLVHPQHPTVFLYKHVVTWRYLCLDDMGHAYTVRATDPRRAPLDNLTCRTLTGLAAALARVYHPPGGRDALLVGDPVFELPQGLEL